MERIFMISPAWDKRSADPNKNYGVHCVDMRWVVKGELGAIQFLLYSGWYPHIIPPTKADDWSDWSTLMVASMRPHDSPMPADLGYHSLTPRYDGQSLQSESCEFLDGRPCYYDGSGLNANKPFSIMVHEGGEALWLFLENYYGETFNAATL